jgi:hypothetical protein
VIGAVVRVGAGPVARQAAERLPAPCVRQLLARRARRAVIAPTPAFFASRADSSGIAGELSARLDDEPNAR